MVVKNGFLTSEFWINLLVQIVGVMALLGYLTPAESENWQKVAVQVGGLIAQCASAVYYTSVRKSVKVAASESECACMEAEALRKPVAPVDKKGMTVMAALLCVGLLANCTYNVPLKTVDQMEPKQKAGFFLSIYNKEFDNYKAVAARPDLTEEQRVMLRKKKEALVKVYPMIETYADYVAAGAMPSKASEEAIIKLLDEIGSYVE